MIMGTPSYMAPEQARGERVDHRADIYAVGAILYCALTGQRPFDHPDPTATLTQVLTSDPPRPRSIEPSIPEPLEMIIQKAMAKRPQDRYESMAELDEALSAWEPGGDSTLININVTSSQPSLRNTGTEFQRVSVMNKQVRQAAMARPLVVILTGLGTFWAAGTLVAAITAVVRLVRGGGARANLEDLEAIFLVLGIGFTLLTPGILLVRHLAKNVWENSVKAVELAETLKSPVLIGLSAYGFGSLLVRLIEAVLLRHAVGVAWPWWDLLLFLVGGAAAGGAYLVGRAAIPRAG
jgi:serine/threonine-protein kinase